jgi:hypothetical protein
VKPITPVAAGQEAAVLDFVPLDTGIGNGKDDGAGARGSPDDTTGSCQPTPPEPTMMGIEVPAITVVMVMGPVNVVYCEYVVGTNVCRNVLPTEVTETTESSEGIPAEVGGLMDELPVEIGVAWLKEVATLEGSDAIEVSEETSEAGVVLEEPPAETEDALLEAVAILEGLDTTEVPDGETVETGVVLEEAPVGTEGALFDAGGVPDEPPGGTKALLGVVAALEDFETTGAPDGETVDPGGVPEALLVGTEGAVLETLAKLESLEMLATTAVPEDEELIEALGVLPVDTKLPEISGEVAELETLAGTDGLPETVATLEASEALEANGTLTEFAVLERMEMPVADFTDKVEISEIVAELETSLEILGAVDALLVDVPGDNMLVELVELEISLETAGAVATSAVGAPVGASLDTLATLEISVLLGGLVLVELGLETALEALQLAGSGPVASLQLTFVAVVPDGANEGLTLLKIWEGAPGLETFGGIATLLVEVPVDTSLGKIAECAASVLVLVTCTHIEPVQDAAEETP